jgi:CDGSH-type Zn-finger protein
MTSDANEGRTTRIYRKAKGQIVVEGKKVHLTDMEGNPIKHGNRFTLCGCTKSKDMPFCDGSHKL